MHVLKRSATVCEAQGAFTHGKKAIVFTALKRPQAMALRQFVRATEPNAFILISNTSEIIGKGYGRKLFETLEADELAAKATRVWLTSSDMAVEFYEHMGWVNPNGPRARAGEDNLLYMEKRK